MDKRILFNTLKKFAESIDMTKTVCNKTVEKIFLNADIFASVAFVKEHFRYSRLNKIHYIELGNESFELDYTLEDLEDEETVILAFTLNKKRVPSISDLFDNATAIENEISKKYEVSFVNSTANTFS